MTRPLFSDTELVAGLNAAVESVRTHTFSPAGIDGAQVTDLLDEMVERGWITRRPAIAGDGRLFDPPRNVALLDKGLKARSLLTDPRNDRPGADALDLDEQAMWRSLLRVGDPRDLVEAADSAYQSLQEVGLDRTQLSASTAIDTASDYALAWDPTTKEFIPSAPAPTVSDAQQRIVRRAAFQFRDQGDWPQVSDLIRTMARTGESDTVSEELASLSPDVGFVQSGKLIVSSEGLALAGECDSLLEVLLGFAQLGCARYLGTDDVPRITSDELAEDFPPEVVGRLETLLETEGPLTNQWSRNQEGRTTWTIGESILRFRDCSTIEDYLRARRRVLGRRHQPTAPAVAPQAAPDERTAAPPNPRRSSLARAVSEIWSDGNGPTHAQIARVFDLFDLDDKVGTGSKSDRVYSAIMEIPEAEVAHLVRPLLDLAEEYGCFSGESKVDDRVLDTLRKRIAPLDLTVTSLGQVAAGPALGVDAAVLLDHAVVQDHIQRAQMALRNDDTALLIGTSKELLETISKFVLTAKNEPVPDRFPGLLAKALQALGLHAKAVAGDDEIAEATRRILGALQQIGVGVNDLRNARGTGHGRPTAEKLDLRHARLAGGAAIVLATIMLDTFDDRADASD